MRKLHKSSRDKMIDGVCGGLAEYFNIDSSIVRIVWVLFALNGIGVFAYIICVLVLPYDNETIYDNSGSTANIQSKDPRKILGIILIFIGLVSLLDNFTPLLKAKYLFPVALIILGIVIIVKGKGDNVEE